MCGYCLDVQGIYGYKGKYCNYTSKRKLGWFPPSRRIIPVGNSFNIHHTKIIIEHKRYGI